MTSIKVTLTLFMIVVSAFIMIYVVESFYEAKASPEMTLSVKPQFLSVIPEPEVIAEETFVHRIKSFFQGAQEKKLVSEERVDLSDRQARDEIHHGLCVSAMTGEIDKVRELLAAGVSANARDSFGIRAIARATIWGHYEVVKLLLKKGAQINEKERLGVTLLMLAANQGDRKFTKLFLEHGADVSLRSDDGETALSTAEKKGYYEVSDLLRKAGATDAKMNLIAMKESNQENFPQSVNRNENVEKIIEPEIAVTFAERKPGIDRNERIKPMAEQIVKKPIIQPDGIQAVERKAPVSVVDNERVLTTPSLDALTWAASISSESIQMVEEEMIKDIMSREVQEAEKIKVEPEKKMRVEPRGKRQAMIGGKIMNSMEKTVANASVKDIQTPRLNLTSKSELLQPKLSSIQSQPMMPKEIEAIGSFARPLPPTSGTLSPQTLPHLKAVNPHLATEKIKPISTYVNEGPALMKVSVESYLSESEIVKIEEKLRGQLPSEQELDAIWEEISKIQIGTEPKTFEPKSAQPIATLRQNSSVIESAAISDFEGDMKSRDRDVDEMELAISIPDDAAQKVIHENERSLQKPLPAQLPMQMTDKEFEKKKEQIAVEEFKQMNLGELEEVTKDISAYTPVDLFQAVLFGAFDQVQLIIKDGVNINTRGDLEMTPLMVAAQDGRTEVVKILLANGADVHARNIVGYTALRLASLREHHDIMSLLKHYGARE